MHYLTEHAISDARIADLMPIRCVKLDKNGYYHLRAATGEARTVAAGTANTAWSNAQWPKTGKWAVIWPYGSKASEGRK